VAAMQSEASMLAAMKDKVRSGVKVQDEATAASLANFLSYGLRKSIRPEEEDESGTRSLLARLLCHPFVTMRIYSLEHLEMLKNGGILCGDGRGPPGWRAHHGRSSDGDLGLGSELSSHCPRYLWKAQPDDFGGVQLVAVNCIPVGTREPVCWYVGHYYNGDPKKLPPGRNNITLVVGKEEFCVGELSFQEMLEKNAPGALFNAGRKSECNLRLARLEKWVDRDNGLVYIPLYTTGKSDIPAGSPGLWRYKPFVCSGGNFVFNDALFKPEMKDSFWDSDSDGSDYI